MVVKKEVKDEDEVEAVLAPQADEAEDLGKPKTKKGRKPASKGKASPKKRRT